MESSFLTRDQTLRLWSGSTDSKTLDYQRTNPRVYKIVRTPTKETTWIQDPHHPTTSSTLHNTPHPNNKQNKNTNPIISRQDYHLTQPCPSEEKQQQQKTQHKSHPIQSSNKPLDQTSEGRNQRKKEFNLLQGKNSSFLEAWEKETSNTITLKKNLKGREILRKWRNKLETQKSK